MFCVDASVIISAAREVESYSKNSRAFLNKIREDKSKVLLPEILIPEVASGLLRATRNPDFSKEFSLALRTIPNFIFIPHDQQISDLTIDVITKTGLRSADAIYVALALKYNVSLITLDEEQIIKGKKLINVFQPMKIL